MQKIMNISGHDYERLCTQYLECIGYSDVRRTSGSGDQGVDIVATRSGERVAFQCKYWKSKVNNKAVQEVFAGMSLYRCTKGIVITNNIFQPSAIQLARATGVELMPRITPEVMAGTIARSGIRPCVNTGDSTNFKNYRHKKIFSNDYPRLYSVNAPRDAQSKRPQYPRMEKDRLMLTKHVYWVWGNIYFDYTNKPIKEKTYQSMCVVFNVFFWATVSILLILISGEASKGEVESPGQALVNLCMVYSVIILVIVKWLLNRPIRRLRIARKRRWIKTR